MSAPSPVRRSSRPWIWFFLLLILLTATAITIQVWYNRSRLLTLDQVLAAETRWREKGPADYDLEYTTKTIADENTYQVRVRGGKVIAVTRNGLPVEERLYSANDMRALLQFVEEFVRQDLEAEKSGARRPYIYGDFSPDQGYLRRFVRSVGPRERVEINTHLTPVTDH